PDPPLPSFPTRRSSDLGLFRPTAEYVRGLGKLRRLLALPRLTEAALDDEKEGHGARPAVVVFEGMADYFASVRGDHALVRESLRSEEHTSELQSPDHLV